ncbi:unnamed protein product [Coregonus sp. 'balchen']|nr:unnamed protein product [Coregonus sp. 'balchen']
MDNNENGKEENTDQFCLDHVLNKLYDFGDRSVSKREHKSQKKRFKRSEVEDEEDTAADDCSDTKDSLEVRHSDISAIDLPGSSEVGNTSSTTKQTPPVEVVTFQDPTKRPRQARKPSVPKDKLPQTKEKKKVDPDEFSLEKARLEVHRFGITGYQKVQQRVFEQERAIMLGARPPKKEYVNYKVLQQRVKDKKQKTKEAIQTDLKKKKKTTKPRDEKRKSSSSKAPTGQVGRFKNGMLVLSTKEIQKIKASIKKK